MADPNLAPPLLDETNAGFITGGVSIIASSCSDDNVPVMGRIAGCRLSADRRTVTLLFSAAYAAELVAGVRKSGQLAVVFSRPSTAQTIQLKGTDATVVPTHKGDVKLVEEHCEALVADVCPLGFTESMIRAYVWLDPADICAVMFTPREAFIQTPGPRAGEPLKGGTRVHAG
jgi:hypothetical protein